MSLKTLQLPSSLSDPSNLLFRPLPDQARSQLLHCPQEIITSIVKLSTNLCSPLSPTFLQLGGVLG